MSLPTAIALNILLCMLLLAALAWTMTRPRRLKPHLPAADRRLALIGQQVHVAEDEQDRRAA